MWQSRIFLLYVSFHDDESGVLEGAQTWGLESLKETSLVWKGIVETWVLIRFPSLLQDSGDGEDLTSQEHFLGPKQGRDKTSSKKAKDDNTWRLGREAKGKPSYVT